jgi:hypothetical protein
LSSQVSGAPRIFVWGGPNTVFVITEIFLKKE